MKTATAPASASKLVRTDAAATPGTAAWHERRERIAVGVLASIVGADSEIDAMTAAVRAADAADMLMSKLDGRE